MSRIALYTVVKRFNLPNVTVLPARIPVLEKVSKHLACGLQEEVVQFDYPCNIKHYLNDEDLYLICLNWADATVNRSGVLNISRIINITIDINNSPRNQETNTIKNQEANTIRSQEAIGA
jgi:hypothetical protein